MTKPSNRGDITPDAIDKTLIDHLVKTCREDKRDGFAISEIRLRLADRIKIVLPRIDPKIFIEWIKDDAQYSFYFHDALDGGACYKPVEIAALILEAIALDALEDAE